MPSSPARLPDPLSLPPPPHDVAGRSLFFDLDGTLIELSGTPDGVHVAPAMLADLAALAEAAPGRVAVVSGRSIRQIDGLLGAVAGAIAAAGSHGAEQRLPGIPHLPAERPPALDAATEALRRFADERGILLETKTVGSALHYRHQPLLEGEAVALAQRLAEEHDLVLQRGKMMVELRAPGDKGQAIAALLRTPAMAGTRPLFFGDDVTDEDGFVAAAANGGAGVLIGEPRPTAALHGLVDVDAMHGWLNAALKGTE